MGKKDIYKNVHHRNALTFYYTIQTFNYPEKEFCFEISMGKGENTRNQHFLLFPNVFSGQVQIFVMPERVKSLLTEHGICNY